MKRSSRHFGAGSSVGATWSSASSSLNKSHIPAPLSLTRGSCVAGDISAGSSFVDESSTASSLAAVAGAACAVACCFAADVPEARAFGDRARTGCPRQVSLSARVPKCPCHAWSLSAHTSAGTSLSAAVDVVAIVAAAVVAAAVVAMLIWFTSLTNQRGVHLV